MSPRHLLGYAARSLFRGGRRSLLAVACIAFGVLSLTAMLLLSAVVHDAMVVDGRSLLAGDLSLSRGGAPLGAADLVELERLRDAGVIDAFSPALPLGPSMVRTARSGRVHFLSRALGVDAATFPLVGEVRMLRPEGATLADALAQDDAVVVTRDVARSLGLEPGDELILGGTAGSPPVRLRVGAIARSLPDRRGDTMLLTIDAARAVTGFEARSAAVLTSRTPDAFEGWAVNTPEQAELDQGSAPRVFDFALKGAGLLGLLVGGIGVANTLQVILARRTSEIAVLKTLGYGRRTLFALFAVETGLLGIVGSVAGAAAALLVAGRLAGLLDGTEGVLLIEYAVDPALVAAGIGIGIITAVLFGLQAIVRAAAVRPSTLLRQIATTGGRRARALSLGLGLALLVACTAVGALVMGSIARGALVIGAGMAGLLALGAVHAGLLFLLVRAPVPAPLVRLAQRNLRHRPMRAVFAVVALFTGVFSIGFSGATLLSGRDRVESRRGTLDGSNFTVFATPADEATVLRALADADASGVIAGPTVRPRRATSDEAGTMRLPELIGHDGDLPVTLLEGERSHAADAVLLPGSALRGAVARVGDVIRVETTAGRTTLRVTGIYEAPSGLAAGTGQPTQAIIGRALALRLAGGEGGFVAHAHVPVDRIEATANALGATLPDGLVVSRADLNAMLIRAYEGLFAFAAGIAGLALLAGAVLVANAVGLGLLERRRELGILKAIGWTRARVLAGVLLENGLLGALAGVTGMGGVAAAITITRARMPAAGISLQPGVALALAGVAVLIALAAATLTAWRPVRVRPLVVLREE